MFVRRILTIKCSLGLLAAIYRDQNSKHDWLIDRLEKLQRNIIIILHSCYAPCFYSHLFTVIFTVRIGGDLYRPSYFSK
jgi:hypothetical protein